MLILACIVGVFLIYNLLKLGIIVGIIGMCIWVYFKWKSSNETTTITTITTED